MGKMFLIFGVIASIAYLYISTSNYGMSKTQKRFAKRTSVKSSVAKVDNTVKSIPIQEQIEKVTDVETKEPIPAPRDVVNALASAQVDKIEVPESEKETPKIETPKSADDSETDATATKIETIPTAVEPTETTKQNDLSDIEARVRAFSQEFKNAGVAH